MLSHESSYSPVRISSHCLEGFGDVRILALDPEPELDGEVAAGGKSDQGKQPLQQPQEAARLLQRLRVELRHLCFLQLLLWLYNLMFRLEIKIVTENKTTRKHGTHGVTWCTAELMIPHLVQ